MGTLTVGSLFAGIGGIDLGFKQAGFEILWANEIDKYACKTYRVNFPETALIEKDVRLLDAHNMRIVDVIAAGFPCQPFSVCGKKQGFGDERGNLFFEIMRFVDCHKPKVVFLENVANLADHDGGKTFNLIHAELASRNYFIRYSISDACDYGIPQHRTRTYIVAFLSKSACDKFEFPHKKELSSSITDIIDISKQGALRYYPATDSYEYKKLTEVIQDNKQLYRFSDYGIQSSKDGISFTLKANMGTWRNRIPYIKDNFGIRRITPIECLALQGFPKDFAFPDIPERNAYKQSGNSVVVPLIKELAQNIKAAIYLQDAISHTGTTSPQQ